jgi:hypothetical protein
MVGKVTEILYQEQNAWLNYYNSSSWEAEAGELWVQGQSGLHSETLPEKKLF